MRLGTHLPEAKEDNPLDAHELCQRFMRCQLLRKDMVEDHQSIQGHGNRYVQYDGESPAEPARIPANELACNN